MKSLQDFQEETWRLDSKVELGGVSRTPTKPEQVILLLHGLNERGRRIYRKCLPYLPDNALILSPNGVFTIPQLKDEKLSLGFAWYFYDRLSASYLINQDHAVSVISKLLNLKNPNHLPLTIIGFSQGGYLAPLLAHQIPETKLVVGIGCEFKSRLVGKKINYQMEAIHGMKDTVIKPTHALNEIALLKQDHINVGWHPIEDAGHEITQSVGKKLKELLESYGKRSL